MLHGNGYVVPAIDNLSTSECIFVEIALFKEAFSMSHVVLCYYLVNYRIK